MYFGLSVSWWLVLPLAVLAGVLLIRIFIIFHDCGHGSFYSSTRANQVVGFLCGLLVLTPTGSGMVTMLTIMQQRETSTVVVRVRSGR